jgi:hypothetical protein
VISDAAVELCLAPRALGKSGGTRLPVTKRKVMVQ